MTTIFPADSSKYGTKVCTLKGKPGCDFLEVDKLTLRTDVFGMSPVGELMTFWACMNDKTGALTLPSARGAHTLNPSL